MAQRNGFAGKYPAVVKSVLLVVWSTAFAVGCAVNPTASTVSSNKEIIAERDLLSDAALAVETTPWPKPQTVSLFNRIAGGDSEAPRITRSDAVAIYIDGLKPVGAKFKTVTSDATANLGAAQRLSEIANQSLSSPRLTMNDVTAVEGAIQALRENRRIYTSTARRLENDGEVVDDDTLDALREAYSLAIRDLGEVADALAQQIKNDASQTYADDGQVVPKENKPASKVRHRRDLSAALNVTNTSN